MEKEIIGKYILDIGSQKFADKEKTEHRIERLLAELKKDREENAKRWEQHLKEDTKRWEQHRKEDAAKWEQDKKKWEKNQRVIEKMLESIEALSKKHDSSIGALGARWGLQSEGAFRNGLKGILEDSFGVKVRRYQDFDREGMVFGRPEQVEMDLIIHDGVLILCEIKSSMSWEEMYVFQRKKEFYEAKHGRKADRVMVISPMVDDKAKKVAEDFGIEVYSYPEDVDLPKSCGEAG